MPVASHSLVEINALSFGKKKKKLLLFAEDKIECEKILKDIKGEKNESQPLYHIPKLTYET